MTNAYQRALALFLAAWFCRGLAASDAGIQVRRRSDGPVAAFGRVEIEVQLQRQYHNPFDPDEIAVDAQVTSPDGKQITVPGFWAQDFPNILDNPLGIKASATGDPFFCVRFCPTSAGHWSVRVKAKDQAGERDAAPITIDVARSDGRGFIRVSGENHAYLEFDSGAAYFPVGLNIAWADGERESQYVRWFDQLGKAGGNLRASGSVIRRCALRMKMQALVDTTCATPPFLMICWRWPSATGFR